MDEQERMNRLLDALLEQLNLVRSENIVLKNTLGLLLSEICLVSPDPDVRLAKIAAIMEAGRVNPHTPGYEATGGFQAEAAELIIAMAERRLADARLQAGEPGGAGKLPPTLRPDQSS
ncbi:hypothetical protein BKE38_04015 [Pseudoroseomonas deserti]|uniref:Uncharacterized protein n=1 Tax=Teichococcus deserti TaxID=1817963 RepID=A0A1V2H8Q8_9PROT|nr:hypothetical protein [Pseudoroseomonas deserti]ONG57325.1 hypothetical protein BKE38_04015 [Pseudoroseomonas deserti]